MTGLAAPAVVIGLISWPILGFAGRGSRTCGMRRSELCPLGLPAPQMMDRILGWVFGRRIAAPGQDILGALIVTERRTFEDKVLEAIASSLSPEHRRGLDASLADEDGATSLSDLKSDPGQPDHPPHILRAQKDRQPFLQPGTHPRRQKLKPEQPGVTISAHEDDRQHEEQPSARR